VAKPKWRILRGELAKNNGLAQMEKEDTFWRCTGSGVSKKVAVMWAGEAVDV